MEKRTWGFHPNTFKKERIDEWGPESWQQEHEKGEWSKYVTSSISQAIKSNLEIFSNLPNGDFIEYGCGVGQNLEYLKSQFPERNIIGIEYKKFEEKDFIHEVDVRNICSYEKFKTPLAFAINELPNWHGSAITKQGGYDHAMANLVVGGLYWETRKRNPVEADYPRHVYENPNLKMIWETRLFILFQKIS